MKLFLLIALASLISCAANHDKAEPEMVPEARMDTTASIVTEKLPTIQETVENLRTYYTARESMGVYIKEHYPGAFKRQFKNGMFNKEYIQAALHTDYTLYDRLTQYNTFQRLIDKTMVEFPILLDLSQDSTRQWAIQEVTALQKKYK